MTPRFILVGTYNNTVEAHLARSFLESHRIPAHLRDEHAVNTLPLHTIALGGVKLYVGHEHAEQAASLLKDLAEATPLDDDFEDF